MITITDMPYEILESILGMTDGKTLLNCMQVCKEWCNIIPASEKLWKEMCTLELKYASEIAKTKCGDDLTWYQLYRNLRMWSNITMSQIKLTCFLHTALSMLKIRYSVVPLLEVNAINFYDLKYLQTIPVALPHLDCHQISNDANVTVIQMKTCLILQRNSNLGETEWTFEANRHCLAKNNLFFLNNKSIYKVNLKNKDLTPELLTISNYVLREIQYSIGILYIYTACGRILSIDNKNKLSEVHIGCPDAWLRRIKHITIMNTTNYVCYSRNFIEVETDAYRHMSIDFPVIMSLFFYGDVILIGTDKGEILLYRLSSQKLSSKPIFSRLMRLPCACISLDVCERATGPVIVAATTSSIYFLKVNFFPDEDESPKMVLDENRIEIFKRLLMLQTRLNMLL